MGQRSAKGSGAVKCHLHTAFRCIYALRRSTLQELQRCTLVGWVASRFVACFDARSLALSPRVAHAGRDAVDGDEQGVAQGLARGVLPATREDTCEDEYHFF